MKLSDLIKASSPFGADPFGPGLTGEEQITSITSDSRKVVNGGLFIAVKGLAADGHNFIEQALKNGATAVVAQQNPENHDKVILTSDSRLSIASIAAAFYGHPSRDLTLMGITGTNGKTSITYLLESILTAAGFSTGIIGTVNIRYNGQTHDTNVTTPDSIDLQKTLHDMKKAGVTHVVMEVSSHGLDLHRVDSCNFNAGIFTNLTQDHLDYHQDMEEYFACKKRFFTHLLNPQASQDSAPAIINIDDPYGKALFDELSENTLSISTRQKADLVATHIVDDIHGLKFSCALESGSIEVTSALTGTFNLENILCAMGAARALGVDNTAILKGIKNCRVIPGRLEQVPNTIDRYIFVDYAHTPDALDSILTALKLRAPKRLICVFGCGGDRDRTKRPQMGQIACQHSDVAIVTSDNPRTEDPDRIINDILDGLGRYTQLNEDDLYQHPLKKGYTIEASREKALEKAVLISKPRDIIVAAGKGHETYQITNAGTIHFDDTEELDKAAKNLAHSFAPTTWTIADFEAALGCDAIYTGNPLDSVFTGISTDSRSIDSQMAFVALKGDIFDGHTFVEGLITKGITTFIINKAFWDSLDKKSISQKNLVFFVCDDTLTALGKLGRFQRERTDVKVLAITGSSGKTTTRRICEDIFSVRYHTHATSGNLNNEIGVPLTLLKLSAAHEWAVIEMGMNHPGEIARLTRIARPDIAMVLNTAGVHLEGLGSVENVAKAKAEIYEGINKGGTAILPANDPRCSILETNARKNSHIKEFLFFGQGDKTDLKAEEVKSHETGIAFTARIDETQQEFSINSPGRFMADNCLAAILAARCADITIPQIKTGLHSFSPVPGRMNISRLTEQITLMDDTYNANPASVGKAIETLANISKADQSVAVLGDMLELGDSSDQLHWEIGQKVALSGISYLFVYGKQVRYLIEGALEKGFKLENIFHGEKPDIAKQVIDVCQSRSWVLVKGSRGMAMETTIETIKQLAAAGTQRG